MEMATACAYLDRGAEDPEEDEEERKPKRTQFLAHLLTIVVLVSLSSKLARESLSQFFLYWKTSSFTGLKVVMYQVERSD